MKDLLPILLLACPLMMLFMMRGHGHGAHAGEQRAEPGYRGIPAGSEDPEVDALREQRDRLEARVEQLEAQMSRLERPTQVEPRVPTPV